jgi:hypothetical protein
VKLSRRRTPIRGTIPSNRSIRKTRMVPIDRMGPIRGTFGATNQKTLIIFASRLVSPRFSRWK